MQLAVILEDTFFNQPPPLGAFERPIWAASCFFFLWFISSRDLYGLSKFYNPPELLLENLEYIGFLMLCSYWSE